MGIEGREGGERGGRREGMIRKVEGNALPAAMETLPEWREQDLSGVVGTRVYGYAHILCFLLMVR